MLQVENVSYRVFYTVEPVNKDAKATYHSVRIIPVSVLSGLSEKASRTDALRIQKAKVYNVKVTERHLIC